MVVFLLVPVPAMELSASDAVSQGPIQSAAIMKVSERGGGDITARYMKGGGSEIPFWSSVISR